MKKQFTNKARYLGLKFTAIVFALLLFVSGQSWGVNIINVRTDVTGTTATGWTDTDISGTTYLQLLKSTSVSITPSMNFDNYTSEALNFKARTFGGTTAAEIILTVWISTDNGNNWTNIGTRTPGSTTLTAVTAFDISSYNGTQVKIKFTVGGTNDLIGVGIDDITISGTSSNPSITTGTITGFGNVTVNATSSEKSYSVSGSNLTDNITITPPNGFEISTGTGASFVATSPITLTQSGGSVASTTIYVRFKPTLIQAYSGNISHNTTSGNNPNVAVSGTGTSPTNPATFTATASTSTQINLSATANTNGNNIVVIYNSSGTFTTPTDGVAAGNEGDAFASGTIIYKGSATSITNHIGLTPSTAYYYKAFSYDASNFYSSGSTANATTNGIDAPIATAATNLTSTGFTANWNSVSGATSYRLDVSSASDFGLSVMLSENFSICTAGSHATPDGTNIASSLDTYLQTIGWSGANIYQAGGEIKLGASATKGTITTKTVNLSANSGNATLTFDLSKYGSDATVVQVFHAPDGTTFSQIGSDITAPASMTTQTISITGGTANSKIMIAAKNASNYRFYLDNIAIKQENATAILTGYNDLTVNATNQIVSGLSSNTNYFYRVRAYSSSGTSVNSNTITVLTNKDAQTINLNTTWSALTSSSNVGTGTNVTIPTGVELTVNAAASCNNLIVQSGGKLTINDGIALTTTSITIEDGGSLIDNKATQSTLTGKMKRNVVAANWSATDKSGYHLIASPNTNQGISGNWISGNYDFYAYDEITNMWLNQKDIANNLTTFTPGKGYLVAYATATAKEFDGVFKNVNVEVNLSKTALKGEGWNLLGNPYPSNLTWNTGWTLTNVEGVAKVWKESSKAYIDVNPGEVIPANQGFWVKANAAVTGFVIPAAARTHTALAFNKSSQTEKLSLTVTTTANTTQAVTNIIINDIATYGYDMQIEGSNLYGGTVSPNLYSVLNDGHKLSTNAIPTPTNSTVINLGFNAYVNGNYTITANNSITNCTAITLEDLKTNTTQNLLQNPVYNFTATTTDNANRFVLHFATSVGVNEIGKTNGGIYAYDNNIYVNTNEQIKQISVYNAMGQLIKTVNNVNGLQKINMNVHATGYYIVKVISDKNVYSEKVLIK